MLNCLKIELFVGLRREVMYLIYVLVFILVIVWRKDWSKVRVEVKIVGRMFFRKSLGKKIIVDRIRW